MRRKYGAIAFRAFVVSQAGVSDFGVGDDGQKKCAMRQHKCLTMQNFAVGAQGASIIPAPETEEASPWLGVLLRGKDRAGCIRQIGRRLSNRT